MRVRSETGRGRTRLGLFEPELTAGGAYARKGRGEGDEQARCPPLNKVPKRKMELSSFVKGIFRIEALGKP